MNEEGALRIGQAAFRPISWSAKDTAQTVREIKVHNEVGVQLKLWNKPASKSSGWFKRKAKPKTAMLPSERPTVVLPPPNATAPSNDPPDPTPWWRR